MKKILFAAIFLLVSSSALFFFSGDNRPSAAGECVLPTVTEPSVLGWVTEDFDGDDAPFKQIRNEVDAAFTANKNKARLLASYKSAAQKEPTDAQSQFRWAYMAYLTSDHWRRNVEPGTIFCGVFEAMGQPTNPRSFEYARLRFIIARLDSRWGGHRKIENMSERLLQKADKNDFDLKYFVLNTFAGRGGIKDAAPAKRALKFALQLQKEFPERTEIHYTLGGIYGSLFVIEKKAAWADISMRYSREYLAFPPIHEGRRKGASRRIKSIKRLRNHFKENGKLKL